MKQVLITGASRGIGRAAAEEFLAHSWSVVGTSRSGDRPFKHPDLHMARLDFLEPGSIEAFAKTIVVEGAHFDALINNAGVSIDPASDSISIDALRKTLEVNLVGLIELTELVIPLIAEGGHIINLSSGLGSITGSPPTYAPSYSISKVGVNMYTRILGERLRKKGITVSSMDPGWVKTDMGGSNAPREPVEAAREIYRLSTMPHETGHFWQQGRMRSW